MKKLALSMCDAQVDRLYKEMVVLEKAKSSEEELRTRLEARLVQRRKFGMAS